MNEDNALVHSLELGTGKGGEVGFSTSPIAD